MNRYFGLPRPVIFAHRGASAAAPENTLAAFQLALEQGADGIELDAKLSRDGEVVVMHDPSLLRTTGAIKKVWECPLAELKLLDAGKWKGSQFAGQFIPTLAEVFDTVGGKLLINVELTNYGRGHDGLVEKVIALVRAHNLSESVLFSSFSPENIRTARSLAPEIPAALLALKGLPGSIARSGWMIKTSPQGLHPYWTDVTRQLVEREKQRSRFINTWTVNDPQAMLQLKEMGVDGIFTDDPLLARSTLEAA